MAFFKNLGGLIQAPFTGLFNAASGFALTVAAAAVSATDVRNFFKLIDMLPGIPDRALDDELLGKSLAFLQMGRTTCVLTFDAADGLAAEFVRMDKIESAALAARTPETAFSDSVISAAADESEDSLILIVNKTNAGNNQTGITADLLANALLIPIENVPAIGGMLADTLRRPVRAIATFILDAIGTAAGTTVNVVRKNLPGGGTPAP